METTRKPISIEAATDWPASGPTPQGVPPEPAPAEPVRCLQSHLPEIVDPLEPADPGTALTETRRLRHDGWTPEKKRIFLSRFAECGVVKEGCFAAGMSARSAYNLRDRDPLFAAGWDAACMIARPRLADEAFSRAMNGMVDRIYKDGAIVAERHRYDNRLTMAVLGRLDARHDRDQERGAPHLALVARWEEYLDALGEDRRDDGLALLAPPESMSPADLRGGAPDNELDELRDGEDDEDGDPHMVWEDDELWWTDYPPPPGFDGEEKGRYGDSDYRRALTDAEQAAVDAAQDADLARQRARSEAQRDAYFADLTAKPPGDSEPGASAA